MKVELLQETEIGAGWFERIERITLDRTITWQNEHHALPRRLREARHLGKNEGIGWCRSYGHSIIVVWRYIATTAQPERRANRRRTIA